MEHTHETLSYREIGVRLGITTDAARMKAKREAKAGRWRLIPGNHPNDPVSIEVPIGALVAIDHESNGTPIPPKSDAAQAWQSFAKDQAQRIADLTTELVHEKEEHGATRVMLTEAQQREIATLGALERALAEVEALKRRMRVRQWIKR